MAGRCLREGQLRRDHQVWLLGALVTLASSFHRCWGPGWTVCLWFSVIPLWCCCSVSVVSDSLWPHELQHTRLPYPSLSPGVCSNSCPLSWCPSNHLTLCCPLLLLPLTFPSIRVFSSQLFPSGDQSIGVSVPASALPVNIQDWFPLGLTGLISLLFEGSSRIFTSITVQKHQFFGAQLSLWSNSHMHTWLLVKP